jgi:hypothetical protein
VLGLASTWLAARVALVSIVALASTMAELVGLHSLLASMLETPFITAAAKALSTLAVLIALEIRLVVHGGTFLSDGLSDGEDGTPHERSSGLPIDPFDDASSRVPTASLYSSRADRQPGIHTRFEGSSMHGAIGYACFVGRVGYRRSRGHRLVRDAPREP